RHPSIASARAASQQAHAVTVVARAAVQPRLSVGFVAARGNDLDASTHVSSERSIGPNLAWSPDINGAVARRVERAKALEDEQRANESAAALALATEVVVDSIAMAAADERRQAMSAIVAIDESLAEMARRAWRAGRSAQVDVFAAEQRVASDRVALASIEHDASATRQALALLTGRLPGEWLPASIALDDFALPRDLPLRLPSELVRQRPDLLAAEARLHAASASIGIASSGLYPNVTLDSGWTLAASPAAVVGGGQGVWSLAATLLAPVFDGQDRQARKQAAVAAYAGQLGEYRAAVLQAFGEVAAAMQALERDAITAPAAGLAWEAADRAANAACLSHRAGRSALSECLLARREEHLGRITRSEAAAGRLADSARWFAAMGAAD
ncbi:MAG TPA: TolC family protein, partial [Burkholderiaceae bacterium]